MSDATSCSRRAATSLRKPIKAHKISFRPAHDSDSYFVMIRRDAFSNFLRELVFQEQQTPLHIASRLGNVDIVMLLLQHGAAVDSTTKDMYTALHIAGKEGQEEVKYLVGRRIMDHIDTVYLMERFYLKRQETFI